MRKLLAAVVAVLLCCSALFAQQKKEKASFGFKAGVNLSDFRTAVDYPDFEASFKIGQVYGCFVEIPLSSRFIFQPEFLYSQLGSKANSTAWGTVTFRYNYFSIPVLFKYKIGSNFRAFAGFQANTLIRARQRQFSKTSTITYDIKDFDFAYTAGVGAVGKRWTVDVCYIHGSQDVSQRASETTFFNRAAQLTFGYKLHKRMKKDKKSAK